MKLQHLILPLMGVAMSFGTFADDAVFRMQLNVPLIVNERPQISPFTAFLSAEMPDGIVIAGQNYDAEIRVDGGVPPYNAEVVSGALPSGVVLSGLNLSGVLLGPSSGYEIRVSDSASPAHEVVLSDSVSVVQPLQITGSVSTVNTNSASTATVNFPSFSGGLAPFTRGLEGALRPGMSINSNGRLTIQSVSPGSYGPYRFWVEDASGERRYSNSFSVSVAQASAMRLTLPGGYSLTLEGWTAAPENVEYYYMHPSGAFNFTIRDSRCSNGATSILIYSSTAVGNNANTSGACRDHPGGAHAVWEEITGQPVPVEISGLTRGSVSDFVTYYPQHATWTKINR